jgi:hypothetical protein
MSHLAIIMSSSHYLVSVLIHEQVEFYHREWSLSSGVSIMGSSKWRLLPWPDGHAPAPIFGYDAMLVMMLFPAVLHRSHILMPPACA